MKRRIVEFTIVSDMVCAWCYLGMIRWRQALASLPQVRPVVTWLPFELNPDMPKVGMDRGAYFDQKFGRDRRFEVERRVVEAAMAAGIALDYGRIRRMPNTHKAHMLMSVASELGCADDLHDRLVRAHFEQGLDIGCEETLLELACSAGMNLSHLPAEFRNEARSRRIRLTQHGLAARGVHGVPCFIIDRQIQVPGAIEAHQWLELLAGLRLSESTSLDRK
jgi:predicted DsbA family dithiol-disulfide isomerase